MNIVILYQTFAIAVFVYGIYTRLWRSSVSTMIFITAAAWCVMLDPGTSDETLRYGGLLLFEFVAVLRAVWKPRNDSIIPKSWRGHVSA